MRTRWWTIIFLLGAFAWVIPVAGCGGAPELPMEETAEPPDPAEDLEVPPP